MNPAPILRARGPGHTHLIVGAHGETFNAAVELLERTDPEGSWDEVMIIEDPVYGPTTCIWTDGNGAELLADIRPETMPTPEELEAAIGHEYDGEFGGEK